MSIGLLSNIGGSVAGSSLAQVRGSDADRASRNNPPASCRQGAEKAELAAGVGQTDGDDHQTADRDADGRQVWQLRRARRSASRMMTPRRRRRKLASKIPPDKAATCSICPGEDITTVV